jgi:hypothetical protein
MKKILSLIFIGAALIGAAYFSTQKPDTVDVPVKDIVTSIEAEYDMISNLMEVDLKEEEMSELNQGFVKSYNINPEDIEEGIIKFPMINLMVEEIAVLKVKDKSSVVIVSELLKEHADIVAKSFENYVPKNQEIANNYILKSKGNYILFVISENAESIEEIFDSSFDVN